MKRSGAAMAFDLKLTESLLYRLITAPSGAAEGLARETNLGAGGLSGVIAGDDRLNAQQRVDIYANMYFYRILDVLKEDYPATSKMLGENNFHNLVTGYLIEYPPTHFSIAEAGAHLPDFTGGHPMLAELPWAADLARMERALIEAFHAADATQMDSDVMRTTAPERWAALRMRLHPAVRMLDLQWDVGPTLRALDDDHPPIPVRREMTILVSRNRNRVEHREIDSTARDAVALLAQGTTFSRLCDAIALAADAENPAGEVAARFDWLLRAGIIVSQ